MWVALRATWRVPQRYGVCCSDPSAPAGRVDFLVPYAEKDRAKALGARWDPQRRKWYAWNAAVAAQLEAHWTRAAPPPPPHGGGPAAPPPRYAPQAHASTSAAAPPQQAPPQHGGAAAAQTPAAPGLTYFAVPFEQKDLARRLGARWQDDVKMWASDDPYLCSHLATQFETRDLSRPVHLPGESRGFAGNRLFIDMIPSTAWYSNARTMIAPEDWDRVRSHVYRRVNYRCECCGVDTRDRANGTRMECHERWDWQGSGRGTGRQVLRRLVGLCRECHGATHYGLAELQGRAEEAMQHLVRVNRSSMAEERAKYTDAVMLWQARSAQQWEPDLSILTNGGIRIQDRRAARQDFGDGYAEDDYEFPQCVVQ